MQKDIIESLAMMLLPLRDEAEDMCGVSSAFVYRFCQNLGIRCEILESYVQNTGHYLNRVDGRLVDFTFRQFEAKSPWPRFTAGGLDHLRDLTPHETCEMVTSFLDSGELGASFKALMIEMDRLSGFFNKKRGLT